MRKIKVRECKATLLQGAGLYIAKKTKTRFDKVQKVKKAINLITIIFLKQLHNNQNKINAQMEI